MNRIVDKQGVQALAEEVFGPERVWVKQMRPTQLTVHLHFPHIHITNSAGQEHDLRDLWVRLVLTGINEYGDEDEDNSITADLQGMRTTFSLTEARKTYRHSHLSSSGLNWSSFCLGSGTPIAQSIEALEEAPTEENWLYLFHSLAPYLSWESLEGVPYITIGTLRGNSTSIPQEELERELERFLPLLPLDAWDYRDTLLPIEDHPGLLEAFHTHSAIRCRVGSPESQEAQCHEQELLLQDRLDTFLWKAGESDQRLIPLQVLPEGSATSLSPEIIRSYTRLLETKSKAFIQKIQHERYKQPRFSTVFGPVGAF